MKKFLLLIPSMLLPYVLLAIIYCLFFTNVLPTNILDIPAGFVLIFAIVVYGFISFVLNAIFALLCVLCKWDGRQIAKLNMIVKLVQIPAYLAIFMLGLIFFITIFTFAFTVFFVVFDCFTIFLSGLTGACAALRCYSEKKDNFSQWFVMGALQFVFIADIICCIMIFIKSKK